MPLAPLNLDQFNGVKDDLVQWEHSYNGITFGGIRSLIGIDALNGFSPADARISSEDLLADDGGLVYARFSGSRTVQYAGTISGVDAMEKAGQLLAVDEAWALRADDLPLYFIHGDEILKQLNCRPTRFTYPSDWNQARGSIPFAAEFVAEDPRFYSAFSHRVSIISPPAVQPGYSFDYSFPYSFGDGSSGGYGICENRGTTPTKPVVTIYGPATNPFIRAVDQDLTLSFDIVLGSTDTLTIDFVARTVLLNLTASRYFTIDSAGWWTLLPGNNLIQYGGGGSADVVFRSAWRSA